MCVVRPVRSPKLSPIALDVVQFLRVETIRLFQFHQKRQRYQSCQAYIIINVLVAYPHHAAICSPIAMISIRSTSESLYPLHDVSSASNSAWT
ncbi:hypothetical protein PGTUg99_005990 [Puccinia graminis f. sp. tritici]|uniref:Uncharacterized protein n=1 Tax=Puccinia graminis f. sp. tritici TaxID=56615 RepID=A0A5B0RCP9_PUCGR|nr:hypothetical protein PGTUg99_005990 [Puccinia graminis f. sp. tritici]